MAKFGEGPFCGSPLRKKPGTACKQRPVPGRDRCRLHGGLSPRGAAHPSFVTGKYSRALPERMAARYQEARIDPALVQLRDELALTESLLFEDLEALKTTGADLVTARDAFERLKQAMKVRDLTLMTAALADVDRAFAATAQMDGARDRILTIVDRRRKLVDSETKRLKTLHQMMTNEQAMTLVGALTRAVQEEVNDKFIQARISARFTKLLTAGTAAA
jgi:hypothetical protein